MRNTEWRIYFFSLLECVMMVTMSAGQVWSESCFPTRVKKCLLTLSLGQSCKSSSAVLLGDVKSSSNEHISQVAFQTSSSHTVVARPRQRLPGSPSIDVGAQTTARTRLSASNDPLCLSYESAVLSCGTLAPRDAGEGLSSADSGLNSSVDHKLPRDPAPADPLPRKSASS